MTSSRHAILLAVACGLISGPSLPAQEAETPSVTAPATDPLVAQVNRAIDVSSRRLLALSPIARKPRRTRRREAFTTKVILNVFKTNCYDNPAPLMLTTLVIPAKNLWPFDHVACPRSLASLA